MSIEQMLAWAATHKYAALPVANEKHVQPTRASWALDLYSATQERLEKIEASIERWNELEQGKLRLMRG